jgi:hypothetical protein
MSDGKHLQILLIGPLLPPCRRVSRRLSVSFRVPYQAPGELIISPADYAIDGPLP